MAVYKDPIIQKIFNVITAALATAGKSAHIKTYFHGDPLFIPKDDLPALIAVKDITEVGDESNAVDYSKMGIILTYVFDVRDFFGEATQNVQVGDQRLYDIVEGRESTFKLKDYSLVNIIRDNSNLTQNANLDMQSPLRVDYGFTFGKRGDRALSQEANIAFNVYFAEDRL